jgi:hypothetical protein
MSKNTLQFDATPFSLTFGASPETHLTSNSLSQIVEVEKFMALNSER